jgi:hypothetical protein
MVGLKIVVTLVVVVAVGTQLALQAGLVNSLVDSLLLTPLSPDQNWALAGNFGPTRDIPRFDTVGVLAGVIPEALYGVYARVGPNPVSPVAAAHHWCVPPCPSLPPQCPCPSPHPAPSCAVPSATPTYPPPLLRARTPVASCGRGQV